MAYPWVFLGAAVLLSIERLTYLSVWREPERFHHRCRRSAVNGWRAPVNALRWLFYVFKLLQGAVFAGWCYIHGDGIILAGNGGVLAAVAGALLILVGQGLNFCVFYRLGNIGVFYGNKFGYEVPWNRRFPFSLTDHPQYTGALMTIWGFFLLARFPHDDWYLLPALETAYYFAGAYFER